MKIKIILVMIIFIICTFAMPLVGFAGEGGHYPEVDETGSKEQYKKVSFDSDAEYSSTEVLVKYSKSYLKDNISNGLEAKGSSLKNELKGSNWVVASVPSGKEVHEFMMRLAEDNNVKAVQPNYKYYLEQTVDDPYADASDLDQWHLETIGAFDAWDTTMGLSSVRVAVLDTGVDLTHIDLQGQIYLQTDVVDNDGSAQDDHGHGTHVCGTIAATANNNNGGAGVAPGTSLIVVDVFDSDGADWWATDAYIVEGINYAIANWADVISMSLGSYSESLAISDAVDSAIANGIVVVAAAGNDAIAIPHYPSDLPDVISVIATDRSDDIAYFSNYGPAKDISAPGYNIYATQLGGGYVNMSGTSMATPIVSGVVALMLSEQPSLTVEQVKNILYNTAEDLGDPGRDSYYGHGRVDAAAAVVGTVDPSQETDDPDFRDGDYVYFDNGDGTCSITLYEGSAYNLTIPDTLDGLTVIGIDEQAFIYGYQNSVTIPDAVWYIDSYAFLWNELTSVDLPDDLIYIGTQAFCRNELTSVTISAGTENIGSWAFEKNYVLDTVQMPTSVEYIGTDAFDYCHADLVFYGTLGSYAQSYASANGIPFYINFTRYEDSVGDGMLLRTFFNESEDVVGKEYYRGPTDSFARIQADYFNMAGTMVFTEIYDETDTIIASVWFQDDGVTKQFKNYYAAGQLFFQEEYDETDTIIASIWFHADGFINYLKNYYSSGVLYFQEEYNASGDIIASIWFQNDGFTRHFKNYYSGYLYFQEEYNTSGTMIASIDFRSDGTRERKCYYRVSDGSLYLIEYYDENEVCIHSEWF